MVRDSLETHPTRANFDDVMQQAATQVQRGGWTGSSRWTFLSDKHDWESDYPGGGAGCFPT